MGPKLRHSEVGGSDRVFLTLLRGLMSQEVRLAATEPFVDAPPPINPETDSTPVLHDALRDQMRLLERM